MQAGASEEPVCVSAVERNLRAVVWIKVISGSVVGATVCLHIGNLAAFLEVIDQGGC